MEPFQSVVSVSLAPALAPSLASAFRECCALHADRPALTCGDRTLSYRELAAKAGEIAGALQTLNLAEESLVAICLERSVGLVASMLGVVLAGHAYLPLDPAYPEARLRATLDDAKPDAMLVGEGFPASLDGACGHRLVVGQDGLASGTPPAEPQVVNLSPDSLAYVIYTSGSTGAPKGVMVSHGNVLRLFSRTEPWFHFSPDDVWTMFHSFAFDFSVWEMWGPLLTGGRLVIVPFAVSRSPDEFREMLSRERVTILNQTPTAFRLLDEVDRSASSPLSLRYIIFGGEALVLRSLRPWMERHGDEHPQLINMYGITETTVHVTSRRIRRGDTEHTTESLIGEPIPDLQLHLLDEHLQPVPDGTPGEIYVGGAGVALGYLHQLNLSSERFLENPFDRRPAPRLYRTGDLAMRRLDGELVYLGRADRQVKINGFRIELAEVEATLLRSPGVSQLCVAAIPDEASGHRLAVLFPKDQTTAEELSRFATENLPAHMRPSLYRAVERLPLTVNGKLDLSGLSFAAPVPRASPGSTLRELVAEAWTQVLGREDLSPDQNFFDAGGTSVQLIALRARLQTQLDRSLPVTWFFQHTTIAALARKLEETPEPAARPAAPASAQPSQRAAWLAAQAKRRQAR